MRYIKTVISFIYISPNEPAVIPIQIKNPNSTSSLLPDGIELIPLFKFIQIWFIYD